MPGLTVRMAPMLRQRLVESSAGNPLALIELPTALSDQQPVSAWAFGERFPLTATLERSFLDRVRLLPDDAQRLLLLAASNESDDADVVLQAAHDMEAGPDAIAAVEDSDLLRFAGHRLQFRHPLVRSAVYESAHDGDRRRAHGALAGALQAETHADRRAWHRALAAVGTNEAVAAELESTAERAQRRSGYAAAARALNRAAQLTPGTVDRARRLVQAGDAAWTGGDKQAAMALLDTADGLDPPPRLRAEILRLRAIMQLRAGDPIMAHDLFVAAADTTDDASKALWLLMLAAEASTYAGRMDWLEALGNRATERNVSSPRDGFVRSMLSGIAHTLRGEYDQAIPLLRESVELAEHTTNPHELVSAGSACLYLGDELASAALLPAGRGRVPPPRRARHPPVRAGVRRPRTDGGRSLSGRRRRGHRGRAARTRNRADRQPGPSPLDPRPRGRKARPGGRLPRPCGAGARNRAAARTGVPGGQRALGDRPSAPGQLLGLPPSTVSSRMKALRIQRL